VHSSVTLDDFIDGIVSGMTLEDLKEIPHEGLDLRLVEAYDRFNQTYGEHIDIRFHLELNPFTRTCHSGRIAFERAAVERAVVKRKGKNWQNILLPVEAGYFLNRLPGDKKHWCQLGHLIAGK
jgi:hypothetical protein